MHASRESADYDVIVVGGALAGAAAAMLLKGDRPELRVLVVEKSDRFARRVGEATVEVSGYFLSRVLGMADHLNEYHLPKQGLRFWFANAETRDLASSSEVGGKYQVRLPSWQIDRAVFDEEVLVRAREAGAEVWRPAQVVAVELCSGGMQTVKIRRDGEAIALRARWVVDATGFAAMLARENGWWRRNAEHPTASAWCRWRGVKNWDGRELAGKFPAWAAAPYGIRHTATNHIVGDGWWSWWIPLKGGDMSVGVVFDQRLVEWPDDARPVPEKLREFLCRHPVAAEMLERATPIEGDAHWRKNLAYSSVRMCGDGFVLVGDASAFMDPFYSPGMDWISFTVSSAVEVIRAWCDGEDATAIAAERDAVLTRSIGRWFEAVYKDKYEYLGDFDLLSLGFRLDLGSYYLGVVSQPFRDGRKGLLRPPFSDPASVVVFHFMRCYNRRLAAMARERRRRGVLGKNNSGRRMLIPGFTLNRSDVRLLLKLAARWGWLELTEGWRSWRAQQSAEAGTAPAQPALGPAR